MELTGVLVLVGIVVALVVAGEVWQRRWTRRVLVRRRRQDARNLKFYGYVTIDPHHIERPEDDVLIQCEANERLARELAARPLAPAGTTGVDEAGRPIVSDGRRWVHPGDGGTYAP